jgi:hypothetical protein
LLKTDPQVVQVVQVVLVVVITSLLLDLSRKLLSTHLLAAVAVEGEGL